EVQLNWHVVVAVVFKVPAGGGVAGLKVTGGPGAVIGGGRNKQPVSQFAARELQDIMQLVVVEVRGVDSPGVGATTFGVVVCARAAPPVAVAATTTMIAKALTPPPRGLSLLIP